MKNSNDTRTKKNSQPHADNTALQAIHALTKQHYKHSSEMFTACLKTGIQMFQMETGLISQVNGHNYKILAAQSPYIHFQTNDILVLEQTYCAEIIKSRQTVWFTRKASSFKSDKQNYCEQLGLITYIGTPLYVNAELYGTLCFASTQPRSSDFSADDIYAIEIMAHFLGKQLSFVTQKRHTLIAQHANLRLNDILKRSNLAILEVDGDGRFIKVNAAGERELGFSHDTIAQKTLFDVLHPEDRSQLKRQLDKLMHKETMANFQGRCLFADGHYHWTEWNLSRQPNNKTVLAIAKDIDKRVNTEQILERYRQNLEKAVDNATKGLAKDKEQFRALAQHLMKLREAERAHIARDIHDELGSSLTALNFDLEWIFKRIFGQKTIKKRLADSMSLVNETIMTTQRITKALRPSILDDLGLFAAVEWYTEEFKKKNNISFTLTIKGRDLPNNALATNIFRLYQESLTNIARHAQATKASAALSIGPTDIMLSIQDNGIGIQKESMEKKETFGLIGMQERVAFLSGTLTISGSKDSGSLINISIPLSENMGLTDQAY